MLLALLPFPHFTSKSDMDRMTQLKSLLKKKKLLKLN